MAGGLQSLALAGSATESLRSLDAVWPRSTSRNAMRVRMAGQCNRWAVTWERLNGRMTGEHNSQGSADSSK